MAIAGYLSQFLVTSLPSVAFTNEAMTDSGDHKTYTITNPLKRYLDKSVPVVVQTSPDGTTWTTITSGFTLFWVNARVVFAAAQPPTLSVRLASGNYFPYAQLGEAYSVECSFKDDLVDVTPFNTSGTKTFLPTLLSGEVKCSDWWVNQAMVNHLVARDLLIVSFVTPAGNRYEGYCYVGDTSLKAEVKSAVQEDLTFQLTDQFFAA